MQINNLEAYLYSVAFGVKPLGLAASIAEEVQRLSTIPPQPGWYHQHDEERLYYFNPQTRETCWNLPVSTEAAPSVQRTEQSDSIKHSLVTPGFPNPQPSNARSFVLLIRTDWLSRNGAPGQRPYRIFETKHPVLRGTHAIDARECHPVLVGPAPSPDP